MMEEKWSFKTLLPSHKEGGANCCCASSYLIVLYRGKHFFIPSGTKKEGAIALSAPLLRYLSLRVLMGCIKSTSRHSVVALSNWSSVKDDSWKLPSRPAGRTANYRSRFTPAKSTAKSEKKQSNNKYNTYF